MQRTARLGSIVLLLLLIKSKLRRRTYITNQILLQPKSSPFSKLLASGTDMHFITLMGMNIDTFRTLHELVHPLFNVSNEGRPRRLNTVHSLGLALHYLNSTMKMKTLSMIFGAGPATLSRTLNETLSHLTTILTKLREARVIWPNREMLETYAAMINQRESRLEHVFGFMDGVYFLVQEPADPELQTQLYNAWKQHTTTCTNVFVFVATGEIAYGAYNSPGTWHDSRTALPVYKMLIDHTPDPFCVVADSAFPSTDSLHNKVLKPLRLGQRFRDENEMRESQVLSRAVTSVRQAAEWGVRALQGGFSRLLTRLPVDTEHRARTIRLCIHLYNLRCRTLGLNQIKTVFESMHDVD